MTELLSTEEALIHVMVLVSAADSRMTDPELRSIGDVVSALPVFRDFDAEQLVHVCEACGDRMAAENGLQDTVALVARSIPEKLRDTAYALGVEVAAADLQVRQEELRMLQILRDAFNLDKLSVAAIERGAQARYRQI
ncbi:tellurite resistance TerB family protein [Polycladidibacter hongkongensis]|uniref:tellurite resistance TerB family protein n=1 Tax=Polycladidibacter hongkongensis TaxID=1647556 RepID=UPI0008320BC3|nr:tellurite resistance TerB family protein [Pseudovibrio hongkongensis]